MNKRFLPGKLLPVWLALSVLLIVAGIVMFSLLGFNQVSPKKQTVEVSYDAVTYIEGKEEALAEVCEKVFAEKGLEYCDKATNDELDLNYVAETGNYALIYTFSADTSVNGLQLAVQQITQNLLNNSDFGNNSRDSIRVSTHVYQSESFSEANWRAAVALGVAAIVALVYVGFRFGWGSAIAGLVACVNDVLVTLSVFALTRIPVYAYAPALFAGIAAVLSVTMWLALCMKMRENFKDPAYVALSAQEAVGVSVSSSFKFALMFIVPVALAFAVLGGLASGGLRLFFLPALLPLAVSVYSSFLLAPAVLVPLKPKFDRAKSKQKRYFGKKKAEPQE